MAKWLRDRQLKEKLGGCSDMTIWRLRRAGKLPAPEKLNGINYTREDQADAAIAAMFESQSNRGAA